MCNETVIAGFAGAAADAFALFAKFEAKLEEFGGNLPRAAVELARTDLFRPVHGGALGAFGGP